MKKKLSIGFYLTILSLILFAPSCKENSQQQDDEKKVYLSYLEKEKPMLEISIEAAFMRAKMESAREIRCMLSEVFSLNEGDINNICKLLTMAVEATDPIYRSIIITKKLPNVTYSFEVLLSDESPQGDVIYKPLELGLFVDLYECKRFENMAKSFDIPVTACKGCKNK